MKVASNIRDDPKSFYRYVRGKQEVKDTVGPLKDKRGQQNTSWAGDSRCVK